jgi:NAD(P)-dependent dehydrogenase (short-subunit alcohol dehydrogenase family)
VWVVTGGARGIGAAIASAATEQGAHVTVTDIGPGDGSYVHCDVTSPSDLEAAMATAARDGRIDVLVNNAGIHERMLGRGTDLESMDVEAFDRVLAVNLRGAWLAAKSALPYLRRSHYPSVINAASVAALTGFPGGTAYGASKGGVAVLTKCLAVELARYRIRVNAYCPGAVETRMVTDHLEAQDDPAAAEQRQIATHLVRRLGQPADVAALVLFLAGRAAEFINGALIPVDGGSLAWRGAVGRELSL